MKFIGRVIAIALSFGTVSAASADSAASIAGQAALALAGVVALYAPMPAANKKAVAALFKGDTNFPYTARITVTVWVSNSPVPVVTSGQVQPQRSRWFWLAGVMDRSVVKPGDPRRPGATR